MIAHTFSCNVEIILNLLSCDLRPPRQGGRVFTYSLVCQYVKELYEVKSGE